MTTEPPILLQSTVSDAIYRAALSEWRRTHAEGAIVAAELRLVEQHERIASLRRVLRMRKASDLHAAVRRHGYASSPADKWRLGAYVTQKLVVTCLRLPPRSWTPRRRA